MTGGTQRLELLLLASHQLPQSNHVIPFEFECVGFPTTHRACKPMAFEELGFLFASRILPDFATLDQGQKDLGRDCWQTLSGIFDSQIKLN